MSERGSGRDGRAAGLRILVVTNMWPGERSAYFGIFVQQQVEALRRAAPGWTFDVLPIGGYRGRLDYLRAIPRVRRALRKGYDVVHAHYGFTGVTVALADRGTPLVVTLHGGDANIGWQRAITKLATPRVAAVIAVSSRLRDAYGDADAVVVPCGVEMAAFESMDRNSARDALGVPRDAFVPLFAADPLNPIKDYPLFEAALEGLSAQLRSRTHPITLGRMPPVAVPVRMAAADVVVLTSISEGSPMVVKEALACGVPVVSVDVGDVREVLAGMPGCAVTARDAGALANAMATSIGAVRDHERGVLRQRLIELRLDSESVAHDLLGLYERVAGTPAGAISERWRLNAGRAQG